MIKLNCFGFRLQLFRPDKSPQPSPLPVYIHRYVFENPITHDKIVHYQYSDDMELAVLRFWNKHGVGWEFKTMLPLLTQSEVSKCEVM